jgi:hypothetical protein
MAGRRSNAVLAVAACAALTMVARRVTALERFTEQPGAFAGEQHWTNYARLADLDGDGDLDAVFPSCAGFFANPVAAPLLVYRNDGGTFSDVSGSAVGGISAAARVVALGDVDNDGDLDLLLPSAAGDTDRLFINDGTGSFVDEAASRLGSASSSAAARFGDVDGDGDLDLLIAGGYDSSDDPPAQLYLNDGSGNFSAAAGALPTSASGTDPNDLDFVDVDRDFDLDVLVNMHEGRNALWLNDGTGAFSDASAKLPAPASSNYHYGPSACDVDGDDDLDLWIDNIGGGFGEQLLINDGSGNFSDETASRVSNNPGADDNGVACADVDGDGDFDVVIASLSNEERVLLNDGTGNFDAELDAFSPTGDPTLWIDLGDVNGDGRIDAITGQGEGSPQLNRLYLGAAGLPVDTRPPKILAVDAPAGTVVAGEQPVVRFAVSDQLMSDGGPRLARAFARLEVDGTVTESDARFMGGDLFRAQLPPHDPPGAKVSLRVCAVDRQGNEGCSAEHGYAIDGSPNGAGGSGGSPTASTGASSSSSGGAGGQQPAPPPVDDGGCGCTLPGTHRHADTLWLSFAALALTLRRQQLRRQRG